MDGGYVEIMLVEVCGFVCVLDDFDVVEVVLLLCVGFIMFNVLCNVGVWVGDVVVIYGFGGFGYFVV